MQMWDFGAANVVLTDGLSGSHCIRTQLPSRSIRAAAIPQVHTGMWHDTEGLIGVTGHASELGLAHAHAAPFHEARTLSHCRLQPAV